MSLPQFQSDDRIMQMLQNTWATQLNPLLQNPTAKSIILKDVQLAVGTNNVNTRLGRKLQGWQIIRQRAAGNVFDTQDSNLYPELTLTLVSDAVMSVDLLVF